MIMININNFIQEKLKINSKSQVNTKQTFTDEELRHDYTAVNGTYTKAEKQEYAHKYDIDSNKFREIQLVILDKLRENRHNKKEYDKNDAHDFYRFDIPDTYKKSKEFFDKEPIEFIEYLKSYFENESEHFKRARQSLRRLSSFSRISIADRHQLTMYNNVIKYLEENK